MRAFALLALGAAGCFSPQVRECAVTCSALSPCPGSNVCLSDGFCHLDSRDSLCGEDIADAAPPGDAAAACGNGVLQADLGEECDDGNGQSTDGCDAACAEEDGFVCVGQPSTCRPTPSIAGQLVITELMINPGATGDLEGEWFEILNATATDLDLRGLIMRDETPGVEVFQITVSVPLDAGDHLVFGVSTDVGINGGAAVDIAYGGVVRLGNAATGDGLVLEIGGTLIDQVSWTIPPDGASLSLSRATYDAISNDSIANFCDGQGVFGTGDTGTPGDENPNCP